MDFKHIKGNKLIKRYRKAYRISPDFELTESMIMDHFELEKELIDEIMFSTVENRAEVFERCYSKLYKELEWINQSYNTDLAVSPEKRFGNWVSLIGPSPKKIYEIGSGKGEMIRYLADLGHKCKATEITRERGEKWLKDHPDVYWGNSDGVNLKHFEKDLYDIVISNQVIEHLHPDDLCNHFRGALQILKSGGKYIFTTPHKHDGPHGLYWALNCENMTGMHLKEYTYAELKTILSKAGFKSCYAVRRMPSGNRIINLVSSLLGSLAKPAESKAYLSYLCLIEWLIALLPRQSLRRKTTFIAQFMLFTRSIFMVAKKE